MSHQGIYSSDLYSPPLRQTFAGGSSQTQSNCSLPHADGKPVSPGPASADNAIRSAKSIFLPRYLLPATVPTQYVPSIAPNLALITQSALRTQGPVLLYRPDVAVAHSFAGGRRRCVYRFRCQPRQLPDFDLLLALAPLCVNSQDSFRGPKSYLLRYHHSLIRQRRPHYRMTTSVTPLRMQRNPAHRIRFLRTLGVLRSVDDQEQFFPRPVSKQLQYLLNGPT